jgi:hypothetical protein
MTEIRPKPFMPPSRDAIAAENHRSTMRMLFAIALGRIQNKSAEAIVREHWSSDATASLMTRAAMTSISTTNSGLPMLTGARLLPSLIPKGAGSRVLAQAGLKLDFSQAHQLYLSYLGALPEPIWITESGAFPVVSGTTGGLLVGPTSKLGFMLKFTNELANYAIEDGFTLFSRMMVETATPALDKALFSSAAGSSMSQPGLLYNVTPLPPAAGGGLAALVGDLKKMAGAMATSGVTSDGAVIVAHTEQAEVLNTLPPQPLKHEVFGTVAVPVGTVIMLQTEGLVTGYDGDASIFVSPDASAHMEDTSPAADISGAAPVQSSFQTDSKLLKMVLRCAWQIRPGAIQYVTGTTW